MGDVPDVPDGPPPPPTSKDTSDPPHHHFHIHLPHPPTTSPPAPGTHHIHFHIPNPLSKPSWTQPPFFRPSSSSTQQQPPAQPSSTQPLPPAQPSSPRDPSLLAFAAEKSTQHPSEDGSFGTGYGSTTMSWGAGSWTLPHEGDTKRPPDERRGIHYHYHLEGVEGDWKEVEKGGEGEGKKE